MDISIDIDGSNNSIFVRIVVTSRTRLMTLIADPSIATPITITISVVELKSKLLASLA
jgi:hypothetical protein